MAEGKRPGAATGAGVIEIIFGAWWIIGSLIGLAGSALMGAGAAMSSEVGAVSGTLATVGIITLITSLVGIGIGVIGLIAGILLLSNKKNGIGLSNLWIWGAIALFAVGVITSILNMSSLSAMTESFGGSMTINFGVGALILGIVWGIVWQVAPAVVVMILLKNKAVKEFYK